MKKKKKPPAKIKARAKAASIPKKRKTKKPAPVLVNLEELGEMLDLSLPPLRKLVRSRGFPVEKRGSQGRNADGRHLHF